MPRTARIYGNSGYYHVVNRGIGKQILFEEDEDYLFYLRTLRKKCREEGAEMLAYCLMENHVHLLLHCEDGLKRLMQRVSGSYARYYNEKYERTGHVFQDRYRSEPIESDSALLAAARYIHNNPQKAGICSREAYRWSSWREYVKRPVLVRTELILDLSGGAAGFREFSAEEDEGGCLDVRDSFRLTDRDAQKIIRERLRMESGTMVQGLDRGARDDALRTLKGSGLSLRQIERLTGINRKVIRSA